MEIFINELSLHGQYSSRETFTQAVKQFVEVFLCVQDKVKSNEIFKDEFFADREALINETFKQSFETITNPQLKALFKGIIFNKLNPRNWQKERLHSSDVWYNSEKCVVQDEFVTDTSVAEIAERKLQRPHRRFLLINFNESQFKGCDCFDVNKEGEKKAIQLECIETKDALIKWLDLPVLPDLLDITAGGINRLILLKHTHTFFKRVDTPKVTGEQMHIHFNDKNLSALNIDGTWKHGGCDIPTEAKPILIAWGFKIT
jgi:hypothetical protein